jgi:hypothetical protein
LNFYKSCLIIGYTEGRAISTSGKVTKRVIVDPRIIYYYKYHSPSGQPQQGWRVQQGFEKTPFMGKGVFVIKGVE